MKAKILIITSKYLFAFVQDALIGVDTKCDIKIVEYDNFYHAIELYRQYEEQADGFMVSGRSVQAAISKAVSEQKKPIVSFEASIAGEYRLLLEEFLKNRQLDTSRVILDSFLPIYEDASVEYFLYRTGLFKNKGVILEWLDSISLEEIADVEKKVAGMLTKLWDDGKVDLVICHYGSVIPVLEQHEIPYRYSGPSKEEIRHLLNSLLSRLKEKQLHENLTGVLAVSAVSENGRDVTKERMKEVLLDIKNDLALDVVLQEEGGYYYVFTTLRVLEYLTDGFHKCGVSSMLKEKYNIEAYIGYGLGYNITAAKGNARDALKEAIFSKGCYAVDEQNHMFGPLGSGNYLDVKVDVSDEVFKAADRCKLSSITIQKLLSIIEMTGSSRITQQNLAKHLGVTSRNAGRILSNLVKGGAASMVYTQSLTSKGRPVKVYELHLLHSETVR